MQAIPAFLKKKKSMTTNVIHLIIFNKINSFNNIIKKTLKVNKAKNIAIINYKKLVYNIIPMKRMKQSSLKTHRCSIMDNAPPQKKNSSRRF